MTENLIFKQNLLALAAKDQDLCEKLARSKSLSSRYRFMTSRNGPLIPALSDNFGTTKALHSIIDPFKEATRLISQLETTGCLIVLGLGGGHLVAAGLAVASIHTIIIIDFDMAGIRELFQTLDYVSIIRDPRTQFLIDPEPDDIRKTILNYYQPSLSGGISVLPLRPRTELAKKPFLQASEIIRSTIDIISDDFSVQAHFGKRWFANTFRNLGLLDRAADWPTPIHSAVVVAAGPSLDIQLPSLRQLRSNHFFISTDTALPVLLAADLSPDAVIAIDCQQIGYYHFMDGQTKHIPLFLDLAAPSSVAARSDCLIFFTGNHPLTNYCSKYYKKLPWLDTTGANVTYAAVSLSAALGAQRIVLYGADFAYPLGNAYARGTYIHSLFQGLQNRFSPIESSFTALVFRNDVIKRRVGQTNWQYETQPLSRYRQHLEHLIPRLNLEFIQQPGLGAPIKITPAKPTEPETQRFFRPSQAAMPLSQFITGYRQAVAELPAIDCPLAKYLQQLNQFQADVLSTLLPSAAFFRRQTPTASAGQILETVRLFCLDELDRLILSRQ